MRLPCPIKGCQKSIKSNGVCGMHDERMRRNGHYGLVAKTPQGAVDEFLRLCIASDTDDCIHWPFWKNADGYGKARGTTAHRVVCAMVNGDAPNRYTHAAHSCGNRACVNPRHIRWASALENARDKEAHGTHRRGENVATVKLSDQDVCTIRHLGQTTPYADLAARYGVSSAHICKIVRGTRRHHSGAAR